MIRVLVVDDSALMRRRIREILSSDQGIQVIDTAKTGEEAIKKVVALRPDVITMDLEMPDIDGLTALNYIMSEFPTPVVIISASVTEGNINATKALELGAVATVAKPSGEISLDIDTIEKQIIDKVKEASRVDVKRIRSIFKKVTDRPIQTGGLAVHLKKIVVIGASTGGPQAIKEVLSYFPANIQAAFLIVQHMPAVFTTSMAERLNWISKIGIKEAEEGDVIKPGFGYLAPGDYHMIVETCDERAVIHLTRDPPVHSVRPSVTVTMNSVADIFGSRAIGILLTGMGQDGVEGMRSIHRVGGKTLAEDESTCMVFGMPKAAIKEGIVDKVVPIFHMGLEVLKFIES